MGMEVSTWGMGHLLVEEFTLEGLTLQPSLLPTREVSINIQCSALLY